MKKVFKSIVTSIMALSLVGCKNQSKFSIMNTDEQKGNERIEMIVNTLESQNKSKFESIFSDVAINEMKNSDIEVQIDNIMEFFVGKTNNYEGTVDSSTSKENGLVSQEIVGIYKIETDEQKYHIRFIEETVNEISSDKVGVYMLEIVTDEVRKEEGFMWTSKKEGAGIYIRE